MTVPYVNERIEIIDPSGPGHARRRAVALATYQGADEETVGRVAIVTTELAHNLVAHTAGGEILLRAPPGGGVEILALDRGPGIAAPERALQDGYSTAGTSGTGLGGVIRLSNAFDLYSLPGVGTAIWACLDRGGPDVWRDRQVGTVCCPLKGELACGDGWALAELEGGVRRVLLVDGLGHGAPAAEATHRALEVFESHVTEPADRVLERIHLALRPTRGAAVGLATFPQGPGTLEFTGVGNIAGTILPADDPERGRGLTSHNGTAGYLAPHISTLAYAWPAGALLILHTDGLLSRYTLGRYPGLMRRHPALIAGILYRDFSRGRDDVGVVVARASRGQAPGPEVGP